MRIGLAFAAAVLMVSAAEAQTYNYTARTEAPVAQSGEVTASGLTWQCENRRCTISGPWPVPGEGACAALASEVGRIAAYGHPGRQLDAAALERCNRNAAQPVAQLANPNLATRLPQPQMRPEVRPEPRQQVQAVTSVSTSIAAPTIETITINDALTGRFYAIRDGGGDWDFGGNGPRVDVSANLSIDGACIVADIAMTAVETRSDWTRGRATARPDVWCNPDGQHLIRIDTPTRDSASYTDSDWQIDTLVGGHGEVDATRTLPASRGSVRAFMVMGDTTGDVFSNNDDGRDVGDLDENGDRTVSRTSVQVQFNPIRVVRPIPTDPGPPIPAGSHTIRLRSQHTDFHVLRHTAGDGDFFGHGPRFGVTSRLDLSGDGRSLVATITGQASETGGDTRAAGNFTDTVWTAPAGWRIDDVTVWYGWDDAGTWRDVHEPALRRTVGTTYTDGDHEEDFLVEGFGEADRHPDSSISFSDEVRDARLAARSHVHMFRTIGDTDGSEAGSRTGVQVFYRTLYVTLSPTDPARANVRDFDPDVFLDVPTGDFANQLSGGNSCGPQAGSRVLRYYGVSTTYEQFKRRVNSSGNAFADQSNGTPPGTLRDRMNDLSSGFVHDVLPLGNPRDNDAALARIRQLLDQGRPVMVLVGWGGQFARDSWSPHDAIQTAHWVVVNGYDSRAETFHIIDNGHAKQWSYDLMAGMMDWGIDLQFEIGFAIANVEKGSIIYRR